MPEDAPVVFNHLVRLYHALEDQSVDGVFTGSTTETFRSLGVSQAYYSKLYGYLYEMGCLEQLQRGTSGTPSKIRIVRPPDIDEFRSSHLTDAKPRATLLEQRVKILEGRLPSIDLAGTITQLETRLASLEREVKEIASQSQDSNRE